MLKSAMAALIAASFAAPAFAGPPERLGRIDKRLTAAERNGVWEQGSRADRVEDRVDRFENRVDRREDRRDRAVTYGPLDRVEDRFDQLENRADRREDRRDRRN
ncbi:MAG: hypothetical protein AAFX03_00425 [Pseudomonadota bacterium]